MLVKNRNLFDDSGPSWETFTTVATLNRRRFQAFQPYSNKSLVKCREHVARFGDGVFVVVHIFPIIVQSLSVGRVRVVQP